MSSSEFQVSAHCEDASAGLVDVHRAWHDNDVDSDAKIL